MCVAMKPEAPVTRMVCWDAGLDMLVDGLVGSDVLGRCFPL